MQRSILLFPEFSNHEVIGEIRNRYDPLASSIGPHITLVFPFVCDLTTEALAGHMQKAMISAKPFLLRFEGFSGDDRDGFLFLNVKRGNDDVIALHDRLYTDVLAPFLYRKLPYFPHLTVGRLRESAAFDRALEGLAGLHDSFETVIDRVWLETIGEDERSIREQFIELK